MPQLFSDISPIYPTGAQGIIIPGIGGPSGPIFELQTGATDYLRISEILVSLTNTSSNAALIQTTLGVGVPAARGTGNARASVPLSTKEDAGNTNSSPGVVVYTGWTTQPTAPTNYLRRISSSSANNAGQSTFMRFRFGRGLGVPPSSSLVLWLISTSIAAGSFIGFVPVIMVDG